MVSWRGQFRFREVRHALRAPPLRCRRQQAPALIDRFGSFTVHKWKEYGFRLIGFWTPVVSEKSNQIVYIWGWESYEERTKKNAAWRADPERAKKWAETEKDGPLVNRVYNQLMEPTSYSQLDRGEAYGPDAATRKPVPLRAARVPGDAGEDHQHHRPVRQFHLRARSRSTASARWATG